MPHPFIPYVPHDPGTPPAEAAADFLAVMRTRRSVRQFSDRPVGLDVMEAIVGAAATAPSGANKQPWRFVCVQDPALKHAIREGAEAEERLFYAERAPQQWLDDLAPLGVDADKPFLETAPWLVVVFRLTRGDDDSQIYYGQESVGLAAGLLLAAIHHAGLSTLTHTPSPMAFLRTILGRPEHEKPFLLLPVGWAADGCEVPDIQRKPLAEVMVVR